MYFFQAQDLDTQLLKKQLSGTIIPRPIALVVTQSEGVINLAPFSYFNIVANDPPIISVSIQRLDGKMKDTARNIIKETEATVHIVTETNVELANQSAANLGPDISELTVADFSLIDSKLIDTPGIKEASVRYETKLFAHHSINNSAGVIVADLLLLEVIAIHLAEEIYDAQQGYILIDNLQPVSRLAGSDYATMGGKFELVRPD